MFLQRDVATEDHCLFKLFEWAVVFFRTLCYFGHFIILVDIDYLVIRFMTVPILLVAAKWNTPLLLWMVEIIEIEMTFV